jgi:ABC-type lipoprotein export system ATPase subunit
MNILGGLDRPSAGRVTVDGLNLLTLSETALNHYQQIKVGFVWQQTSRNLIPYLTAQENIELPMTMAWLSSPRQKHAWSGELLQAVGLYERRKHNLSQLSGGEQQRVAIAVSLANKPVLLLGDEPTGEVDSATAQTILDTFRRLGEQMDLTIVIVTHDTRLSGQVDRVVAIRDGKISTETVRQVNPAGPSLGMNSSHPAGEAAPDFKKEVATYHEYVVLDSAGRLQVPREILENLGIGKRAHLETGEDCIIIRPAAGQATAGEGNRLTLEEQLALLFNDQAPPPPKRRRGLFGIRRRHDRI